ncbi:MAG: peptide-methionine (R)-S-oxide reductase MsrB, partial [Actinomycetota bacterium]
MSNNSAYQRPEDTELRARLDDLQWHVTQEAGTERAFTGIYWDNHDDGVFRCVVCGAPLFESDDKYDSGTGWPSFSRPASPHAVEERVDRSHGMSRTEVVCASCG